MSQLAMYIAGSVVVLLALDGVSPATQQVSTIASALSSTPAFTSPAFSNHVNRAAKGDRLTVVRRPMKPQPDVAREPTPAGGNPPVGCEFAFSPVVSPSLANIVGRCMVENESRQRFAQLMR